MVGIGTERGNGYQLKVTKRKMRRLVKKYTGVTVARTGLFRRKDMDSYHLDFLQSGKHHYFFLSATSGTPLLTHSITNPSDDTLMDWHARILSFEDLKKLGMVEKVPEKRRKVSGNGK